MERRARFKLAAATIPPSSTLILCICEGNPAMSLKIAAFVVIGVALAGCGRTDTLTVGVWTSSELPAALVARNAAAAQERTCAGAPQPLADKASATGKGDFYAYDYRCSTRN
jgi:hypothetical protein